MIGSSGRRSTLEDGFDAILIDIVLTNKIENFYIIISIWCGSAVSDDGDNSIDYIINNPITNYIQYDRLTTCVYSWQKGLKKTIKWLRLVQKLSMGILYK